MAETSQPVRLARQHLKLAIEVMGKAFVDDPFLKYLAPDEAQRTRLSPTFLGAVITYCLDCGEVWTTSGVDGCACWLPPGKTSPTLWRLLRTGMITMPLKFGWAGFQRLNAVGTYAETLHKRFASGQHWYLWAIGVEPTRQGKGIGGRLLQPVLARADADGVPCYLETEREANLAFYQKHGFQVVGAGDAPKGGLRVWALLRAPRR